MLPASLTRSLSLVFFTLATSNTKRTTLVLAALLWAAVASPSLAITYTTLDDPLATRGTSAYGIDGSSFVGEYLDAVMGHGILYNGITYKALDDHLAGQYETSPNGISGNNIVGTYFNNSTGYRGFLFNGSTYTTLDDPLETQGTYVNGVDGSNIVGAYNIAPLVSVGLSSPGSRACSAAKSTGHLWHKLIGSASPLA